MGIKRGIQAAFLLAGLLTLVELLLMRGPLL